MDVILILRPLQQLEEKLGELYTWFAESLSGDAEAAGLFHRMALDEKSHASRVEFQRRLARQNPRLFSNVALDVSEVLTSLDAVERVRRAPTPPPLPEAVTIALGFENAAADFHYRNAIGQSDPELARLLASLGSADRQHRKLLAEFARQRGLAAPEPEPPAG